MSIMRCDQTKVILTRSGPDDVWQMLRDEYAGDDPVKLKNLAMLALREDADWPLEWIGDVFAHHKGHVLRCLRKTCRELREQFELDPTWRRPPGKSENRISKSETNPSVSNSHRQNQINDSTS